MQWYLVSIVGILKINSPKKPPKGKWPYRLYQKVVGINEFTVLYNDYCAEAIPFGTDGLIALDVGGGLVVIDSSGNVVRKERFGVAKAADSKISPNPSCSKISMVRWKGDDQKLMVLDLKTSEFKYFPPTVYWYSWISDDEVLFEPTGSVYRILDTITGKTQKFRFDFDDMLSKALPLIRPKMKITINHSGFDAGVYSMGFFNGRIYYCWGAWVSTEEKEINWLHGVTSSKMDQKDFKLEYYTLNNEIIREFQVDPQGVICAYVESNPNTDERQWRYSELDLVGSRDTPWKLLTSNSNPRDWNSHSFKIS